MRVLILSANQTLSTTCPSQHGLVFRINIQLVHLPICTSRTLIQLHKVKTIMKMITWKGMTIQLSSVMKALKEGWWYRGSHRNRSCNLASMRIRLTSVSVATSTYQLMKAASALLRMNPNPTTSISKVWGRLWTLKPSKTIQLNQILWTRCKFTNTRALFQGRRWQWHIASSNLRTRWRWATVVQVLILSSLCSLQEAKELILWITQSAIHHPRTCTCRPNSRSLQSLDQAIKDTCLIKLTSW